MKLPNSRGNVSKFDTSEVDPLPYNISSSLALSDSIEISLLFFLLNMLYKINKI